MSENDDLARELEAFFIAGGSIPTSGLGRLARTARAGLGIGLRTALGRQSAEDFLPLVRSLGELKGLGMKLGQLMSFMDDSLPPEARRLLTVLQTFSPPADFSKIQAVVRHDLGGAAPALLDQMEPKPVAAASIGQVHRSRLPDGTPVAVKVQYPEIEEAIRNDFKTAGRAVALAKRLAPGVEAFVEEAATRLTEECDYVAESAHQRRFGEIYAAHPILRVPAVFEAFSAQRVLTTAWHEGAKFDVWLAANPPQAERNQMGAALYEFYLGTLYRHGLFNADPHPGNYLFAPGQGLVMLDYGCVRTFSAEDVALLKALRKAAILANGRMLSEAFRALGANPGKGKDFEFANRLVRAFFGPTLEDRVARIDVGASLQMRQMLADKRTLLQMRLPGKLLFLFRIKFGVQAVLARMGAEGNWYQLEEGWVGA